MTGMRARTTCAAAVPVNEKNKTAKIAPETRLVMVRV